MAGSSLTLSTDRRRLLALFLTLVAHALIVFLLFRLGAQTAPPPPRDDSALSTFDVMPSPQAAPTPGAQQKQAEKPRPKTAGSPPPARPRPQQPKETSPPTPPVEWQWGPKDLFRSADISKLPSRANEAGESGDGTGRGADAGDSVAAYGPGAGPGGQRLYNAEWYVRPTQSQLSFYMPASANPGDRGTIACQTMPDYRVDHCRALGDEPLGSGISRAMRQAAWQFRVRPPRIGGKSMIGAWVRIEISITPAGGATVKGGGD